nr:immunoglobulin light chain junction region [Macaca mulatta]
CQQGYSYPHSV